VVSRRHVDLLHRYSFPVEHSPGSFAVRMVGWAVLLATVLYLVPVAVLLATRSRRDRALWEIALELPLAVALDLMLVMLLARVVVFETAVLLSRGLWLGVGAAVFWRARRAPHSASSPRWPRSVRKWEILTAVTAGTGGWLLSTQFSRLCHGFDRNFHIPLATALRGQTLPFENAFDPGVPLAYHLSGDLLATELQVLSGNVLHMSLALSLAHDICFALCAVTLALFIRWMGVDKVVPAVAASLAPLVAGPLTLLIDTGRRSSGHNFINFYKLSFRPHVVLAGLLILGFVGAVIARTTIGKTQAPRAPKGRDTALVLIATTAVLAVTDEPSVGVLGLSLGATWLFAPNVIHPKRWVGLLVLGSLLVAVVLANLVFSGALAQGTGTEIAWVPARAPGYYRDPISLDQLRGVRTLQWDVILMAATVACGFIAALTRRRLAPTVFFYGVLLSVSIGLLIHIDVGHRSIESHRFMTAPLFCAPVFAAAWIAQLRERKPGHGFDLMRSLLIGIIGISSICTLDWVRRVTREDPRAKSCPSPQSFRTELDFYDVDCRELVGAELGQRPVPVYLEHEQSNVVAGCRPIFGSGPVRSKVKSDRLDLPGKPQLVPRWEIKMGPIKTGADGLKALHELVPSGEPLPLVCSAQSKDIVCRAAGLEKLPCRSLGQDLRWCELPAAAREPLLRRVKGKKWNAPLR